MSKRRKGRILGWVSIGLGLLLAGASAGWAASSVLSPPPDVLSSEQVTYATVSDGEVGASISLVAIGEWTFSSVGVNKSSGVVTNVLVAAGEEVTQGRELYSVDLRPVVVAQGSTPAFRLISAGTEGPDVAQLQQLLGALGFYDGDADGKAGSHTVAAIKEWQKSRDLEQTGVVDIGDVIFVPSLPARVFLDPSKIALGASVGGGEAAVQILAQAPSFTLPATDAQARMMPPGTPVEISATEGDTWHALTGEQTIDASKGTATVMLTGVGGGPICDVQCPLIPLDSRKQLPARVITVETVSGLVVPSAALVTDANGSISVVDEDGSHIPVKVVTSARGMSVIEGVAAGTRVELPMEPRG